MVEPYYERDGIVIYCGDCREILPTLDPVDLVLTDPPYGAVNRGSGGLRSLDKGTADIVTINPPEFVGALPEFLSAYVWCGTEQVSEYRRAFVSGGCTTRLCVWEKSNPSPMNGEYFWLSSVEACVFARRSGAPFNTRCASPVWRGPSERHFEHLTPKPEWLMRTLIAASTNAGELVLDPFLGSGTTLRAAKDLGRRAVGIEISERFCEIAAKRLAQQVFDIWGDA